MLLHPLTYTREAASCPTFLGWTAEAVGGAADGISGGRDGMIFTPPFLRLYRTSMPFRYRRKAASGASIAAKSYAPSQPLLRVHTNYLIHNKFNL